MHSESEPGRPLSLLVVDDSPVMRTAIRRMLALSGIRGHQVWEAGDGEEALRVMEQRRVDAVMTDIHMPRMSGPDLIRAMRASPTLRDLPVIVISTDSSEQRIGGMRAHGANGYLSKPFRPDALRAEIERVLG